MNTKEQQVDQLLRGVYRMCVNRDDCSNCPFFITKCTFGEPKPSTWFDEESIEIKATPEVRPAPTVILPEEKAEKEEAPSQPAPAPQKESPSFFTHQSADDDNSEGTWVVSTSMGSVFSKYVFICSKCGYKKESMFSFTPMTNCPECEKRKAGLV